MRTPSILIVAPYGFHDRMPNFIEFVTARILAKNGWHVTALTRAEGDNPEKANVLGIEVYRYKNFRQGALLTLRLVLSRPDIIHVHNLRNNRVGALISVLAKGARIPLVFTEYGLPHDHYLSADRDDPFERPLAYDNVIRSFRALIRHGIKDPRHALHHLRNYLFHQPLFLADTVIFVSKHNLAIAETLGLKNYVLLPHVLDNDRWNIPARAHTKAGASDVPFPKESFALFVGQMKFRKGWDTYLRAIPHIPKNTLLLFALATQTADISPCTALVKELGIEDRVVIMHRPSNETLHTLFETCAIVVVPSYYEGFGLVPLEAFESRKPLVASRVEALTDFLKDGMNARLVPSKDPQALAQAVTETVTDKVLATTLVEGGAKTLVSLRSDKARQEWLRLYTDMLSI